MELKDIVEELKKEGFSNATANYHGKKVFAENYGKNADKYTHKEKEWANQHGFTAEEVRFLGLNDENYTKYLSSYDYHLLDPIDPFTKRLVDGKLVIPFTIGGRYPEYLPKYYCWVFDENTVIPMNDNPVVAWNSVKDYLIQLLDKVGILAIKPYTGGGGIGFIKLEKICNHYYSNGEKVIDLQEVVGLIKNKYIVTEYVRQCKEFDDVWKDSAATLRVVTINKNNKHI
ncbi:MAG: hypothetical protein IJ706_07505 [Clostridia bacterium]|nr:hypothetical protein [Clostridia bacterium]